MPEYIIIATDRIPTINSMVLITVSITPLKSFPEFAALLVVFIPLLILFFASAFTIGAGNIVVAIASNAVKLERIFFIMLLYNILTGLSLKQLSYFNL